MNIPLWAGLAFAVFSAIMLWHAVAAYRLAKTSRSWPGTIGRITEVRLWGLRNVGGEMKDVEKLAVGYEFEVGGSRYTGTSATFYTLMYPETVAVADRLRASDEVKVHYQPTDPKISVLLPGPRKDKPYSDLTLGVVGMVIGVAVAILGWLGVIG